MPKVPTDAPKGKTATKNLVQQDGKRKVKYPKPSIEILQGKKGAMTAEQAKELLGWVEETEKVKFGSEFFMKDTAGVKVRCLNNTRNRPLYPSVYHALKQEILQRKWELNFENIIIGRTALVMNGQHRMIALILAVQEWRANKEAYPQWKSEPYLETTIAYGAAETDAVANTMDTARPRSLSDVLYGSPYFSSLTKAQCQVASRMTDYAVRLLWDRTGAKYDAYAPRRSHQEAMAFIDRHPKLLECVAHVREEDTGKKGIAKLVNPGTAAGLMYMMGSSTSDPATYQEMDVKGEAPLSWANFDKASEFFVQLADVKSKESKALTLSFRKCIDSDWGLSMREKWALLIQAWLSFASSGKVTAKKLELRYFVDEETGGRGLDEMPTVGGIDRGDEKSDELGIVSDDPGEVGLIIEADEIRGNNLVKGHKAGKDWGPGDSAWVYDPEDPSFAPYFGRVIGAPYMTPDGRNLLVQSGEDEWEASVEHLTLDCPASKEDE